MKFSEKRPIAWIVLVVCVLASIVGFGGGSMAGKYDKAEKLFYDGYSASGEFGSGMAYNLGRIAEYAATMATEAKIHLGQDNAAAIEMAELADIVGESKDLDKRSEALSKLKKDREELYAAMVAAKLPDDEFVTFKRADSNFASALEALHQDEVGAGDASYAEAAKAYNNGVDGFPASMVMNLLGKGELSTFGE